MSVKGPSDATIRRLFAVSMNRCAFPDCSTPVVDLEFNTILAEVCHIRARNRLGPRFLETQTDEERHGFDNLVLMCGVHHKLIDSKENEARFSSEVLLAYKADHESRARSAGFTTVELTAGQLDELQSAVEIYESGSVHNDYRHGVFRVGGEGGHWAGGGGGGGILYLVGTTRVPQGVVLDGEGGQAPGGGGGGGGSVQCLGRLIDNDDLARGLQLSSMFLANAASFSGQLINVLGAAWTFMPLSTIPSRVASWLVLILEMGAIDPATLLSLSIRVYSPSGVMEFEGALDVEVNTSADLVNRSVCVKRLEFDVKECGIWTVDAISSRHQLGSLKFECRSVAAS